MNSLIITNATRFIVLILLQGLVLQNIGAKWEAFPYFHIVLFPIFILLLPMRIPRPLEIFLGFAIGMLVDAFYNSLGVHASAAVFTAFIRPIVLDYLEPRGGYNVNYSPTAQRMGMAWYMRYSMILMLFHLFFYFFVEAFTPVYMIDILLKTFFSFIISMVFIIIHQFLFNPLD